MPSLGARRGVRSLDFKALLDPDIQAFMQEHQNADVKALALKKMPDPAWPATLILGQIKTRQKAQHKTPEFAGNLDYIFPPNDLYEQVSSEACARFKASLFSGEAFVDLSAGGGVDGYYIAQNFKRAQLIEHHPESHAILAHNLSVLPHAEHIQILCADANNQVSSLGQADLVFIDPQRREAGRKGIFDFAQCSPNILELLPVLKDKTTKLCIKTSPVLDIEKACRDLGYVHDVYVVEYQGDCKEVLYVLDFTRECSYEDVRIHAQSIGPSGTAVRSFTFTAREEAETMCRFGDVDKYLYEPSAAFMKAAAFKLMAARFGMVKLHAHSHLYTSGNLIENFPGKFYEVHSICAARAKDISVRKGELVLRNFPGDVPSLRKKLKLKEGSEYRLFATTLKNEEKSVIICRK